MIRNFLNLLVATLALSFAFAAHAAVDVNKASQAELETIKGIGPSMSGKILDARKSGAFKDWPDVVTRVKGVGPGNASKFSADGLTVNGAEFKPELMAANKPSGRADKKAPATSTVKPRDAAVPKN